MKLIRFFPLLALFSLLTLQSCDDELFDVKESFTFQQEFVVLTNDATYQDQAIVNLAEKETLIEDYGSKIKDIEIESVKYWLKAHNGSTDQRLDYVSLEVANADASDVSGIADLQNVNLAALLNNSTALSAEATGIAKLENLIKQQPHTFMLKLNAGFNEVPADFIVVFEFKVKMTANALK